MKHVLWSLTIFFSLSSSAQVWKNYSDSFKTYYQHGNWTKAISFAEKAKEAALNDIGTDHAAYGDIVHNLGLIYRLTGVYEKALPLQIESQQNAERFLGPNDEETIARMGELADLYQLMGEFGKARLLYDEAFSKAAEHLGKNSRFYNSILSSMATLKAEYGDFNTAELMYLEALENTDEIFGKTSDEYATILNNLSGLYMKMGLHHKALESFLASMEITESSLGDKHPYYAISLSELATLYQELGMDEKAVPLYQPAIEIAENTLSKQHSLYSTFTNNLAFVYEKLGEYEKAETLFLEAKAVAVESLGKEHYLYGRSLNNLAHLYHSNREYSKALHLMEEALSVCEKTLGKQHSDFGMSLNNLAHLYMDMGEYPQSEVLFLKSLENARNILGENHQDYAIRLKNLACLYETRGDSGDIEQALQLAMEAVRISQQNIRQLFPSLSEKEKTIFLTRQERFSDILLSLSLDHSDPGLTHFLFENQVMNKGLILNQSRQVVDLLRQHGDSSTQAIYYQWMDLRKKANAELTKPLTERSAELENWQEDIEKLESQLALASKHFEQLQGSLHFKASELQHKLGSSAAYVQINAFRYWHKGWTDTVQYVAFIMHPNDSSINMIHLGNQFDFLASHNSPGYGLYHSRGGFSRVTTKLSPDQKAISNALFQIQGIVGKMDTIYFSLSGLFNQVNVAATVLPNKKRLWNDGTHIAIKTTIQPLLYPNETFSELENAALFGGIDYNQSLEDSLSEIQNSILDSMQIVPRDNYLAPWTSLGATALEVENIAALGIGAGLSIQKYTDDRGSETAFKKLEEQRYSILHVATHGFFFEAPSTASASSTLELPYQMSDDPMLRSGLVLAGANQTWMGGFRPYRLEDGILTAREISTMNLSGTQLVVLSACETGLGQIDNSQGVYGLQRAFKMAGADYLIISLWGVPDQETSELMTRFYKNWLEKKMTLSDAFYGAQQTMAKDYRNQPELWAGFILIQ